MVPICVAELCVGDTGDTPDRLETDIRLGLLGIIKAAAPPGNAGLEGLWVGEPEGPDKFATLSEVPEA